MSGIVDACKFTNGFAKSPIAFISHECKQVVIHFLIEEKIVVSFSVLCISIIKAYCITLCLFYFRDLL